MGFRSLGLIDMRMPLGDFSVGYSTSYVHGTLRQLSPSPARLLADSLVSRQFIYPYVFASDTHGTLAYQTTLFCHLYPRFSGKGLSISDISHYPRYFRIHCVSLLSFRGCLFTPKFLVALILYPVTCYFRSPSFCLHIRKWLIRF